MSKKTLISILEDFTKPLPTCPSCNLNKYIVKSGTRKVRKESIQIYFCKSCKKRFNDRKIPRTSYPPKLILRSLTYFNLGHTLAQIQSTMQRKYKIKIPISTLNNWVHKYENELPAIKLRRKFNIDPKEIIKTKKLQHQQPYIYQIHTLKFNFATKQFPKLTYYLNQMLENPQDHIFRNKDVLRCSELAKTFEIKTPKIKQITNNLATRLTYLSQSLVKTKKTQHQTIEDFFLSNDSVTIACEIPVYILNDESNIGNNLTGHIDILQVRNNRIYILDYKPDIKGHRYAPQQLLLYSKALETRTGIPQDKIMCGFFNENNYFEFSPNLHKFEYFLKK